MNQKAVHLTAEGIERLQEELDKLVNVRRPALAERLRRAIQQGDLSENADYITAKEEQGFLEGRILEIEAMLRQAVIIAEGGTTEEVRLGSRVTVVEEGLGETEAFHLVGPAEADPIEGRISYESPLGRELLGCKVGERVRVQAPAGDIFFRIEKIE
ncbi:MAG: transcription elongation factor GreA [Anaerolineae bacterium]|nr:transcription elongation factor GreA [Anaerolineae bacterium]